MGDLSVGLHGGVKRISSSEIPSLCSLRKLLAKLSSTMVVVFKVFHTTVLIFFHSRRLTLLGRTKVSMAFSSPNPKEPKTNPTKPKTNPTNPEASESSLHKTLRNLEEAKNSRSLTKKAHISAFRIWETREYLRQF
jgi:hypothetical protein